jgi:BirA family biotin operon repressor/biotin-[acetyl-CoA-carboxylase] ligase
MAAVAVAETLRVTGGGDPDIKWPNDVLLNGRKVCGILAETVETPYGRSIVLGIGINLMPTAFPPELAVTAISLEEATGQRVERETILAVLVSSLTHYYELFQQGSYGQILNEWRQRSSYASGKLVRVATGEEIIQGVTRGLEDDGALRVETANGAVKIVHAGDVTALRPYEKSSPGSP